MDIQFRYRTLHTYDSMSLFGTAQNEDTSMNKTRISQIYRTLSLGPRVSGLEGFHPIEIHTILLCWGTSVTYRDYGGVAAEWNYVTASPSCHDQALPVLSPVLFVYVDHPLYLFIPIWRNFKVYMFPVS